MQVKHITGVGLTSRRTTKEKRHLTVGHSLLGQIIVEDHSVLAIISEVLAHSTTSVRGKELQGSRIRGSGGHDDGMVHGIGLLEGTHKLSNGGSLLTNTNVDAHKLIHLILGLLVDDGVNGHGSLSSLTITNDQLTLSTANGDKSINSLQTSGHGLMDGLSGDDTRGLDLSTRASGRVDSTLAINGLSETINDTAQKLGTDRDIDNSTGSLHGITLKDGTIITKDNHTNIGVLKIESHSSETRGKDNHLSSLHLVQAVHTSNTISNRHHLTNLIKRTGRLGKLLRLRRNSLLQVVGELYNSTRDIGEVSRLHQGGGSRLSCKAQSLLA
mmetsp:Transcript_11764/g.21834  ORF Transcript_11764/g.21834 Transcript_11764/m.21834 type:complete len:328 (-) Transcript_11764:43-1026(-)